MQLSVTELPATTAVLWEFMVIVDSVPIIIIIKMRILIIIIITIITDLDGPVVTHSTAGVKGPGFNSPVARAYLRFNFRPSTLAGKQC